MRYLRYASRGLWHACRARLALRVFLFFLELSQERLVLAWPFLGISAFVVRVREYKEGVDQLKEVGFSS